MAEIVTLQDGHVDSVVRLHMDWLPTQFLGTCGHGLLRTYYRGLAQSQGSSSFVALDGKMVVGYICGIWNSKLVQKSLITKYGLSLLYWGLRNFAQRPAVLSDALVRVLDPASKHISDGYEIRPIVVAPTHRGTGLSKRLMEQSISDALQMGYPKVQLFCAQGNYAASKLYERLGFVPTEIMQIAGQSRVHYEIVIGVECNGC